MISGIAPELITTRWFNTDRALTLADLRGRVVVIEAFQMLCPGCVSHSLPQAMRVAETFSPDDVAVIGLHTVFEHHAAQGTEAALAAFLHEYRIRFPVAIDAPSEGERLPRTMKLYGMEGTPTVVLIDREGRLRNRRSGVRRICRWGPKSWHWQATTETLASGTEPAPRRVWTVTRAAARFRSCTVGCH